MKKVFFSALAISTILFSACNSNSGAKEAASHDTMKMDDAKHATADSTETIKKTTIAYTNVDATAASSIKAIGSHYLHIKNALVNDNSPEAATGAKAMLEVLNKLDKSLLSAEQKTAYDKQQNAIAKYATAIAANGGKIKEQRAQFASLSESMYELVKSFGAGLPLYHDHCPMARDQQGAMWLSETKEVKNPYFGAEMPTCGTVEEVIE